MFQAPTASYHTIEPSRGAEVVARFLGEVRPAVWVSDAFPSQLATPAGVHERYFEELAELLARPGPPDIQAIAELRKRYATEQVSPLTA